MTEHTLEGPVTADTIAAVETAIDRELAATGGGGIAWAITNREGLLYAGGRGFANIDAQSPVTHDTLFEFGSIGKSFTAICLLQLAEEGRIDLHKPVSDYLPWFKLRSSAGTITLHHLLSHTSGMIGGNDASPDQQYEVWAARDSDAVSLPGARFHYSNIGYKTLGLVLEAVTGKPYATIVRERIYDPLGMTNAESEITHAMRRRLAVGYNGLYDDRPWRPEHGLVPATWLETNTGDGCLSANATDLATYCRALLNEGAAPGGRILTPARFAEMISPVITLEENSAYGYGLFTREEDGCRVFEHSGGMVGYTAHLIGDRDTGFGVVAMTNGRADCSRITEYALKLARAAALGNPAPQPPASDPTPEVEPGRFAGVFQGPRGFLEFAEMDGALVQIDEDRQYALKPIGAGDSGLFLTDHPDYPLFAFRFGRDEHGRVVEVSYGDRWFINDAYTGPTTFDTPEAWSAFPGHYRSNCPWMSNFRVYLRAGKLFMNYGGRHEMELIPEGDRFRMDPDEGDPERIRFDTVVEGRAFRAMLPGDSPYYRFFTP